MTRNNDGLILEAAMAKGGAVTAQHLSSIGVSRNSILRRVQSGFLERVFRGVYVVSALRTSDSLLYAAGLAHPDGAACRFSAAYLHEFDVSRPAAAHFVVPHSSRVRSHLVVVHETRDLARVDVVDIAGMPVTSAARTICDIAPYLKVPRLRHIIETQMTRNRPTSDELVACVRARRRSGVPTVGKIAELLALMLDDEPFPESMLELRLFEALSSAGLTGLSRQYRPPWYDGIRGIVDAADPASRTIVEADGRRFRQVTQAHDNDRRRDRLAAKHGFLVLRVGYQELTERTDAVVADIREVVLARRAAAQAA